MKKKYIPLFTDLEEKYKLEGKREGKLEGKQEGELEALRQIFKQQLRQKFGELTQEDLALVEAADTACLRSWLENIFTISLDDLQAA